MRQDWETIYKNTAWLRIKRIESFIPALNFQGKRILDIGCWWGWFIKYAREYGSEVHGLDYELNRIEDAKNFLKNKRNLCVANAEEIPYKDNMFDIVFSYHVIEHLAKDYKMIKEIHRVLKSNGDLILGVPNDYSLSIFPYRSFRYLLKYKENFLRKHCKYDWLKSICYSDTSHYREYTKKSICRILPSSHFIVTNIKSYGVGIPYPLKNRISKKYRILTSWLLGHVTPTFLREELILHAKKEGG
jgi:ubiquinone/menaquinone biosynthesis C-methylase UbiE